jgi:hypothetical protein
MLAAVAGTVVLVAPRPVASSDAFSASASRPVLGAAALISTGAGDAPTLVVLPPGLRVAVEGGDPFVAYRLGDRLVGAGATLGTVAPAASSAAVAATTTIVYYDVDSLAAAGRIRAMLGGGTLRRQRVFQPPVDVTIVLGKDLAQL